MVCSSRFCYIRNLWCIHHHLDLDSAKLLAHVWESSHRHHCNLLLSGIAGTDLTKLSSVQNQLARVVTKSLPFTGSVSLLHSIHWLPTKFGIDFKICVLTYATLLKKQPVYLQSMLDTSLSSLSLRSHKRSTLLFPWVKINTDNGISLLQPILVEQPPTVHLSAPSIATFQKCL